MKIPHQTAAVGRVAAHKRTAVEGNFSIGFERKLVAKSGRAVASHPLNALPTVENQPAHKPTPVVGGVRNFGTTLKVGRVVGQNTARQVPAIFANGTFKTNVRWKNTRVYPEVFGFRNLHTYVGFKNIFQNTRLGGQIGVGVCTRHQGQIGPHVIFFVSSFHKTQVEGYFIVPIVRIHKTWSGVVLGFTKIIQIIRFNITADFQRTGGFCLCNGRCCAGHERT